MAPAAKRRRRLGGGFVLAALVLALSASAPVQATEPLSQFVPVPPPISGPPIPPPNNYFNGPCGVAVDSGGRFYVADHYHDVIDIFTTPAREGYLTQLRAPDSLGGPCALALGAADVLYTADYHREVTRYTPSTFPIKATTTYTPAGVIDPGIATGLAVDRGSGAVYVTHRDRVSVYGPTGVHQLDIGLGSLGDAYGVAVSGYGPTDGYVYVPDASTNTVKVYDSTGIALVPIAGPPGGFVSLRDASVAVDDASGDVYVVDSVGPADSERPRARVHVFSTAGVYEGRLRYDTVGGAPTGIAVDNSTAPRHPAGSQGRVYLTSGNTLPGGVYVYPPDAAVFTAAQAPSIPPAPLGADQLLPAIAIGGPTTVGGAIACEGDACQVLPPAPVDPTLTTLLPGLGNPSVRYRRYGRNCAPLARELRRLARSGKPTRRAARLLGRCRRANSQLGGASASAAGAAPGVPVQGSAGPATEVEVGVAGQNAGPETFGLLPGAAGFDAAAIADGGRAATLAGSHPYLFNFRTALDQGGGEESLRELAIDLPTGFLVNPAAASLCAASAFATPRSSPYDAATESGENCPDRSQVGTVEVTTGAGGGQTRRFGLFNLRPADGAAFQFGAAPFGSPLVFDAQLRAGGEGAFGLTLAAAEIPQTLQADVLEVSLWGTPWDATHNTERGNCLNETEPAFPWSKCSVAIPLEAVPVAMLTLPTLCGEPLSFPARVGSWQEPGTQSALATSGGPSADIEGCAALGFAPDPEGLLTVAKASSASGFVFRLTNEDRGLPDPRARIRSHPRGAVVQLPRGVTLNPSLGAGLVGCTPAQLANESAFNPFGAGCPNGSKIGVFQVAVPFYQGFLRGGIYLAQPDHPGTGAPGAENPFDSLLAVYLIAKSANRGLLIRIPGNLARDPGDGTLTATFDGLPQLPYTDLEVNFRSSQRAPLVSPPHCEAATTEITISPWAQGAPLDRSKTDSQITSGIDFGPCPAGTPPFSPGAVAGGVNSNVGSYTPYFIHLSRKDTEQEITSYSLVLPKGITGKLAGIPFCPDAAIEAARHKRGFDEIANPSCSEVSQVGRTDTGYGVGPALTYAPGRVYLAGPYGGSPLSLVTINAATVGPFDLGTIVIRSAFDVDEHTAQLQIDSSVSDPIPHIIDGVPLHLRDIRIYMDRFEFTHNPSSCEASQLVSTLTGSGAIFSNPVDDSTATVGKYFQLLNCLNLGFRPRLGLRLRGPARRGGYPSLRASFASRGAEDSNLKRIEVEMPHSLFLAQNHIRTVCTRPQFAAERCPEGSIYGAAEAHTLLFDTPLRGNVYLRSSTGKLPDLVADLRSGSIRIVVEGRIGPGKQGGILTFFDNLPDAPIDRFTMTLYGGRRGLLQNSSNICASPPLATISALGQNNIGARFSSTLRGQCKQKRGRNSSAR